MSALTLPEFRRRFPLLQQRTYLNNCSKGALSTDVEAAIHSFVESWHADGSPWERWLDQMEQLRSTFARSIGADSDEVAILPSASVGISALASAMSYKDPRNHVAIGEFEFPTMTQIWLAQQSRGATIEWVRAHGNELPLESYATTINARTLIVPTTDVCYKNGHRTDIAGLVALCQDRGALILLDDYQRTGTGPIDVHALGVDFMVTGCQKYLLGPPGLAFLYVRRDLLPKFKPTLTGWFGRANPFDFDIQTVTWSSSARRFEAGTPPILDIYAAQAGLDLLEAVGYAAIEEQIAALTKRFTAWARQEGFAVATPPTTRKHSPLVVLQSTDAPLLVSRLAARGVIVSSRDNGLRVSFHGYNTEEDILAVIEALETEVSLLEREEANVKN